MAQEPTSMTEQEREIVKEITTKECGKDCLHCEHTEACDPKLHFRTRYCGACRVYMFHRMQEGKLVEFDEKSEKIKKEGTQEFMSSGRMFFCNPPSYEYVHVNSGKKFTSNHTKLEDAVAEYLAVPDRDLSFDELMHTNLKIRSEQQAKVFVQVYLAGTEPSVREMKVLQEKFARIDKYSSNEFVAINDTAPPYEYIHLNEHVKFKSEHAQISEAIKSYLKGYDQRRRGSLREPYELDNNLGQIL